MRTLAGGLSKYKGCSLRLSGAYLTLSRRTGTAVEVSGVRCANHGVASFATKVDSGTLKSHGAAQ
jgi:hypothetical protein